MRKIDITDELLYKYYPIVEQNLLNELPKEDEIEYEFSEIFVKKINKLLKNNRYPKFINNLYRYSKKISIVILAIIISMLTLTMSIDALRVKLFDFIKNIHEKFTIYQLETTENTVIKNREFKTLSYLPPGFKEIDRKENEDSIFISYSNEDVYLTYSGVRATNSNLYVDTEGAEITRVMINNIEAEYIVKENDYKLVWKDEDNMYILTLECSDSKMEDSEKNTLIKMAEKIK